MISVDEYDSEVGWLVLQTGIAIGGVVASEALRNEIDRRFDAALRVKVGEGERWTAARVRLVTAANRYDSKIGLSFMSHQIKTPPPDARPTVPDMLDKLASIYRERAAVYGDNYLHAGEVLLGLFPRGLHLRTEKDFGRMALVVHVATKLSRYCMAFQGGHADSLDDLSVYAQMLNEFDGEKR